MLIRMKPAYPEEEGEIPTHAGEEGRRKKERSPKQKAGTAKGKIRFKISARELVNEWT
jgi:hypothetical protein